MKDDVTRYVLQCRTFKEGNYDLCLKHVMGNFEELIKPFERMHINIIEPFRKGKYRNKYICSMVDAF